jgi:hypothetical protein
MNVIIFISIGVTLLLSNALLKRRSIESFDAFLILQCLQIIALYPRISGNWPPLMKTLLDSLSSLVSNTMLISFI